MSSRSTGRHRCRRSNARGLLIKRAAAGGFTAIFGYKTMEAIL